MKKKKTKSSIPRKYRKEEPVWRSEAPKKNTSRLYNFDKRYYFNLKAHRWKRHIDGDWDNGPLIYRVPLYPEQAVLSCCTMTGDTFIRFSITTDGGTCWKVAHSPQYQGPDACTRGPGGKYDPRTGNAGPGAGQSNVAS